MSESEPRNAIEFIFEPKPEAPRKCYCGADMELTPSEYGFVCPKGHGKIWPINRRDLKLAQARDLVADSWAAKETQEALRDACDSLLKVLDCLRTPGGLTDEKFAEIVGGLSGLVKHINRISKSTATLIEDFMDFVQEAAEGDVSSP